MYLPKKQVLGKGCNKLLEACMMFGAAADYCIEDDFGRGITKEEAPHRSSAETEEKG